MRNTPKRCYWIIAFLSGIFLLQIPLNGAEWRYSGLQGTPVPSEFAVPLVTNVKSIATGSEHSLALKEGGTVVAWGLNDYGQTMPPEGLANVKAISAGRDHSLALRNDGSVVAWGRDYYGQTTIPDGLSGVIAIDAGTLHNIALKGDGTVIAWGYSADGRTTVPPGLNGVTAISAGAGFNLALKQDGTVVAWGSSYYGATTVPAGLTGVKAIAAGGNHAVALKENGTVVAWGRNDNGQATVPVGLTDVIAITAGGMHVAALKQDGTVVAWGYNYRGATTIPAGLMGVNVIASGSGYHTLALKLDGTVVGWGDNSYGQSVVPAGIKNASAIASIGQHTIIIKTDGSLSAWGSNNYNQATIPPEITNPKSIATVSSSTVVLQHDGTVMGWGFYNNSGMTNVAAISTGGDHVANLRRDGTVVCWGGYDAPYQQTPVPPGLTNIKAVAAGTSNGYTLALKQDGTVVAWGKDYYGSLAVPEGLSGVSAIAAGYFFGVALKNDGTVVAWGKNDRGQTAVPEGLKDVVAIAAGNAHAVALKLDGTVVTWGSNDYGQASIPDGVSRVTAVQACGNVTFYQISDLPPSQIKYHGSFAYIDYGNSVTITGFSSAIAKSVDIPAFIGGKPVTSIAAGAFSACNSLQTVTIPASITFIGSNAFSGCAVLSRAIFVGNAPTMVGTGAFVSTSPTFKVLYNGTATGFSSPTWHGYPSQALVPSTDVFANLQLTCRDREGIMDIVFDYLPTPLNTSPGVGDVRAFYSLDGGISWRPTRFARGYIGSSVRAGSRRSIGWNYFDDIQDDPSLGSEIKIRLISSNPPGVAEASTPSPLHVPVTPVQVNFCFDDSASFSVQTILSWDWSLGKWGTKVEEERWSTEPSPISLVFDNEQKKQIKSQTEAIFQRAGITTDSMTFVIGPPEKPQGGKRVINVFLTPTVGSIWGVCLPLDGNGRQADLDRFGRIMREATVLVATNPTKPTSINLATYQLPANIAEVIAHEVSHGLGMRHINDDYQNNSWENIMDYRFEAMNSPASGIAPNFSSVPKPMRVEADIWTGTHNEKYYLQRWVEGLRNPVNLVPGDYDQESVIFTPPPAWERVKTTVSSVFAATPTLYDVKVVVMDHTGEIGTVVRQVPSLSSQQLLEFQLDFGGQVKITASTTPGGDADVMIVPQAQADISPFSPVQGQAMKVLKMDEFGVVTNIGTGTTTNAAKSPIMPKNINVKPTGFDGAHVQVEFASESGYQYTLERSDDCSVWTTVPALTNVPGSNMGRLSLLDEYAGQEKKQLFYRVKVNMPTTP